MRRVCVILIESLDPLRPWQYKTRVISIHPKITHFICKIWLSLGKMEKKKDRVSCGISRAIYPSSQQANLVTINLDNQSTNNQLAPPPLPTPARARKKIISNLWGWCFVIYGHCTFVPIFFVPFAFFIHFFISNLPVGYWEWKLIAICTWPKETAPLIH